MSTPPLATKEGGAEKSIKRDYLTISELSHDVPMEGLLQFFGASSYCIGRVSKNKLLYVNFKN